MGEGDKRSPRRNVKYDSRELARLSRKHVATEAEWDEKVAASTLKASDPQLVARTSTLDDPLTTSLLAEVARRSKTIEVSPDQIDEAVNLEPGDPDPADDPGPGPAAAPAAPADDPT
jgi:hypothetical protein